MEKAVAVGAIRSHKADGVHRKLAPVSEMNISIESVLWSSKILIEAVVEKSNFSGIQATPR